MIRLYQYIHRIEEEKSHHPAPISHIYKKTVKKGNMCRHVKKESETKEEISEEVEVREVRQNRRW